jgi:hypothetical protein
MCAVSLKSDNLNGDAILAQGKTDCIAFVQFAFHGSGAGPGVTCFASCGFLCPQNFGQRCLWQA